MTPPPPSKLFHRFPFVLFDRAEAIAPGAARAVRQASFDEALEEGRPGTTMGQTLLIEAMAQTAVLFADDADRRTSGMLVGLKRVRFGRPPRPGDRLSVEARFVQQFGGLLRIEGRVLAAPPDQGFVTRGATPGTVPGEGLVAPSGPGAPVEDAWPGAPAPGTECLAEGEILISLSGGVEADGT